MGFGGEKPVRVYPNITISEKDFPDIKDWKIDESCTLTIKVKVTSLERSRWDSEKKMSASVDIVDIRKEEKSEEYKDEYARKMSKAGQF